MLALETLSAFENPGGLSPLEIRRLMNHVNQTSIIDFSFSLTDRNHTPIGVPGGIGPGLSELPKKYVARASAEWNTNRPVGGQMSCELYQFPGLTYNSLMHRLVAHADYWVRLPSGPKRILHLPMGVWMGILPARDLSEQVPKWSLTLYDETFRANRQKWSNNWVVPRGTNLRDEVIHILTLADYAVSRGGCDIAGLNLASADIAIPPDATTAPYDITFTPDDTIMQSCNDLLGACAIPFWPLRQTKRGLWTSDRIPINASMTSQQGWYFSDTRGENPNGRGNILASPVRQSFSDQSELANVVNVLVEPTNGKAFSVRAENHDLRSAISIENYGERVNKNIRDSNITDRSTAANRAVIELQLSAAQNDNLEYDHVVIPVTELHDGEYVEVRTGVPIYDKRGGTIKVVYADGQVWAQGIYLKISETIDFVTRKQHSASGVLVGI